jgi:hypothetical protein
MPKLTVSGLLSTARMRVNERRYDLAPDGTDDWFDIDETWCINVKKINGEIEAVIFSTITKRPFMRLLDGRNEICVS